MPISVYTNQRGRHLTLGLFFETTLADKTGVIYTLKDQDHEGYPSLYRLYMECADPTEFEFAITHLDGWSHWQMLSNANWFKPHIERWRWELELKIKSQALRRIQEEAKEGKSSYHANKFLVEGGYHDKTDSKTPVGRPSQERIKKEAERLNQMERDIIEDHERLN